MRVTVVDGTTTRELRRAVLRPTWPLDAPMHGDESPDAVHIGALDDDGALIGTCLLLPRPYPLRPAVAGAWQLRGMATAAGRRSQGVGARVLAAAQAEITARGGHLVWCEARSSAVAFYRHHGFVTDGDEFEHAESGLPHYRMWRSLDPPSDQR